MRNQMEIIAAIQKPESCSNTLLLLPNLPGFNLIRRNSHLPSIKGERAWLS